MFGNIEPGFSRVTAICDWINNNLDYQAGSSGESTSACDVLIQRVGVCRDYAHLAIALCRALCIPARYISGYAVALQPPDFHGFFEAYLGSRWYLFDATRMAPVEGFVRIGTGRDAADASFATIIGEATLTSMAVWAEQTAPNQITNQPVLQTAVSTTN
jgi:transglutaminase-like putative cysteine protease